MSTNVRYRMENAIEMKDYATYDLIQSQIPLIENLKGLVWDTQRLITLPGADEAYLKRWERSLGVKPKNNDLEERRRYLITLISSKMKVSSFTLEQSAQAFTGLQNRVAMRGNIIEVRFNRGLSEVVASRLVGFIKGLVPAHLGVQVLVDAPQNQMIYIYGHQGIQESHLMNEPERGVSE